MKHLRLVSCLALFWLSGGIFAQTQDIPNEPPLTLAFSEDFDEDILSNWTFGESWTLTNNEDGQAVQIQGYGDPAVYIGSSYDDVAVQARFLFGSGAAALEIRRGISGSYALILYDTTALVYRGDEVLASVQVDVDEQNPWRLLRLSAIGSVIRASMNGTEIYVGIDDDPLPSGAIAFSHRNQDSRREISGTEMMRVDDFSIYVPDVGGNNAETTVPAEELIFTIADGDVDALINALETAGTQLQPVVINLAENGVYTLTEVYDAPDYGNNGLPLITGEVTINGYEATITRAEDAPQFRIFEAGRDSLLTLNQLTISGGDANIIGGSGILIIEGTATLNNSTVMGNVARSADAFGAGIYNHHGSLSLGGSLVTDNHVTGTEDWRGGGGIAVDAGITEIMYSRVEGNSSNALGGGIYAYSGGGISIEMTRIADNTAVDGAGVYFAAPTMLTGWQALFYRNAATHQGGGIFSAGELSTNQTRYIDNEAELGSAAFVALGGSGRMESGCVGAENVQSIIGEFETVLDATENWWGNDTGPSSDAVSAGISFMPFLTEEPDFCALPVS